MLEVSLLTALALIGTSVDPPDTPWGWRGHEIATRAAAEALPEEMPAFFRAASEQLVYLGSEPDRWQIGSLRAMQQAWAPDHWIDIENLPPGALDAEDRYAYLELLHAAGLERPQAEAGFLPFRMLELYQRLVSSWTRWRAADDVTVRRWIEARIVQDAGVLAHYVTDASQPHHTTIHFNGWAEGVPNPSGYTEDRSFHSRFETDFVDAHVTPEHIVARLSPRPRSVAGSVRQAVVQHVLRSFSEVERLYRLDLEIGFDPSSPPAPETRAFAADRLAEGAGMLRTLWWSAWLESAG